MSTSGQEFIVIDSFYKDPDAVRALAIDAEYAEKGALSKNVAGIESTQNYYSKNVIEKLEKVIGKKILVNTDTNAFGRFRLGLECDNRITRVHYDNTEWTAVVYLTPQEFCSGGTYFFRHRETGLISPPTESQLKDLNSSKSQFDEEVVMRDSLLGDRWDVTAICPMQYNRCVLLRGSKYFHGSDKLFGSSFLDGRLTQNFFFNTIGDV